jgi:hypothetical protein
MSKQKLSLKAKDVTSLMNNLAKRISTKRVQTTIYRVKMSEKYGRAV